MCRCGNRYCPTCGPLSFRSLFTRHSRLRSIAEGLLRHRPGDHRTRVLAKLDITRRNTGEMPDGKAVRLFNENIKRLREKISKYLEIARRDFGILYCDEFGSGNTNLHAHGIYVGPWIPQRVLARFWAEICGDGSFIISIKRAKSFEAALAHALKYPSKFFEASPARLAELELAFHKVRRVHALGAFYNPKIEREPGEEGPVQAGRCPVCGDVLLDTKGWHFVDDLRREGRRDIFAARVETARAQILTGSGRHERSETIHGWHAHRNRGDRRGVGADRDQQAQPTKLRRASSFRDRYGHGGPRLGRWVGLIRTLLLQLTVILSRPEGNGSASEEAVWLAADTRREEYFSETRKIQFG